MQFEPVGNEAMAVLVVGTILMILAPVAIALIWRIKKKERFTTVLVGAASFIVFALFLEKIIQAVVIMPTALGLPESGLSAFLNANPIIWSLVVGLFPGVFEETGRLVAFKTLLRNRKNKETAISYGLGHGGIEVIMILGVTYIGNIVLAIMINAGEFQSIVDSVAAQAPDQVGTITALAAQLSALTFAEFGLAVVERIFAVLFHIGASILVFYACRDSKKIWLYPLAIIIHTAMDFVAGLYSAGVLVVPVWGLEIIMAVFGLAVFAGAYFGIYKKDNASG